MFAEANIDLEDRSVDRCLDRGLVEIDLCLLECRSRLAELCLGS